MPTVIDYVIGEGEVKERVVGLSGGYKVDSDHPLEVVLKREGKGNDGEVEKKRSRGVWYEEGGNAFRESIGEVEETGGELTRNGRKWS